MTVIPRYNLSLINYKGLESSFSRNKLEFSLSSEPWYHEKNLMQFGFPFSRITFVCVDLKFVFEKNVTKFSFKKSTINHTAVVFLLLNRIHWFNKCKSYPNLKLEIDPNP